MVTANFDGPGDNEAARETALAVAHEIEIRRRLYNTQVRMKAKDGVGGRDLGMDVVEPARRGEEGTYKDAPVWHCVLALMPGEELSDEKWEQVAETFMDRMGFTGTPDGKRAQARWVAVRHGLSGADGEGQDHIHIAASLVREDGSKVSTYDYGPGLAKGDWRRADEVCGELETERERLRRMVRAVAVPADSEVAFVEGLKFAIVHSTVARPQGRGKVERLFGSINTELLTELPGHLVRGKPVTAPALSLCQLDEAIGRFVTGVYHPRTHSEIGVSPQQAWVADGWLPRMPEDIEQLDLLLVTVATPRVVHRDGSSTLVIGAT